MAPKIQLPEFGIIETKRILTNDTLFAVISDKYPVTTGHALIVPKRFLKRFEDLTVEERSRLMELITWTQEHLLEILDPPPDGFNLGVNDGAAAGQTIPQFHFHIIPRTHAPRRWASICGNRQGRRSSPAGPREP